MPKVSGSGRRLRRADTASKGESVVGSKDDGASGSRRSGEVASQHEATGTNAAIDVLQRSEVEQPLTDGAAAIDGANGLDRSVHVPSQTVATGVPAAVNGLSRSEVERPLTEGAAAIDGANGLGRSVHVPSRRPPIATGVPATVNGLLRSEVERPLTDGAAAIDGANGLDRSVRGPSPAEVASVTGAIDGLQRLEVATATERQAPRGDRSITSAHTVILCADTAPRHGTPSSGRERRAYRSSSRSS